MILLVRLVSRVICSSCLVCNGGIRGEGESQLGISEYRKDRACEQSLGVRSYGGMALRMPGGLYRQLLLDYWTMLIFLLTVRKKVLFLEQKRGGGR